MGTGSVPSISLEKPLKPPHSKKPVVWRAVLRGCWLAMGLVDFYACVLWVSPGVLMDEVNSTKDKWFLAIFCLDLSRVFWALAGLNLGWCVLNIFAFAFLGVQDGILESNKKQ